MAAALRAAWASTMCSTPTLPPTSPSWRRAASFSSASRTRMSYTLADVHLLLPGLGALSEVAVSRAGRRSFPPPSPRSRCSAPLPRATLPRRSALTPSDMFVRVHHALRRQEERVRAADHARTSDGDSRRGRESSPRASWTLCSAPTTLTPCPSAGGGVRLPARQRHRRGGHVRRDRRRDGRRAPLGVLPRDRREPRSRRLHRRARHGRLEGGELQHSQRRARCRSRW